MLFHKHSVYPAQTNNINTEKSANTFHDARPLVPEQKPGRPQDSAARLQGGLCQLRAQTLQLQLHLGATPRGSRHPPLCKLNQPQNRGASSPRIIGETGAELERIGVEIGGNEGNGSVIEGVEDADSAGGGGGVEDETKEDRAGVRIGEFRGAVEALGEGEEVE